MSLPPHQPLVTVHPDLLSGLTAFVHFALASGTALPFLGDLSVFKFHFLREALRGACQAGLILPSMAMLAGLVVPSALLTLLALCLGGCDGARQSGTGIQLGPQ